MSGTDVLFLSPRDVERTGVTMPEIIRAVEEMFREKSGGRTEMPPKTAIHPRPDAFLNAMPAYLPKTGAAGIKWVGSFPDNARSGRPSISALIILNDPETGAPVAVMDGSWITARRTGAATAVAAKSLARAGSEILGVVGCGVQGFSNLEALRCLFPIRRVKAYDLRPEAVAAYVRKAGDAFGISVEAAASAPEAVRGCDLVVTAGAIRLNPAPSLGARDFEPGMFVSAVDYDSSWAGEAIRSADRFATDDLAQMMYYREEGYFRTLPDRIIEIGDLASGAARGRERPGERTMVMALGIALDDMAVAPLVLEKARTAGLGTRLPFEPGR